MLINDPFSDGKIDVTGWDLDLLHEALRSVSDHVNMYPDQARPLTDDEKIALDLDDAAGEVWTDHGQINERLATWGLIIDEAIFQRDLPRARAAKAEGRALNVNEQAAWDRYLADIGSDR